MTTDKEHSRTYDSWEHNNDASAKRVVVRAQDPDSGDFVNIGANDDGDGAYSLGASNKPMAVQMDVDGAVTYLAMAAPGTATTTASWQCRKIDETSGMQITWADGDRSFDNLANNLSGLSYS